jgi:basic membrane protein A
MTMIGWKSRVFLMLLLCITPNSVLAMTIGFLAGSGGLGDESFNDMTYKGLGKAREELGCRIIFREWEQHLAMETLLQELIDEGADLLVLNGNQFQPILAGFAVRYPNLVFIANDFDGGQYANVRSIVYNQHEGAFLAGALAGWRTRTGRVGFIGAIDIPVIEAFLVGFREGVGYASPETRVVAEFISQVPDYSGFNNPHKAYELAGKQYAEGSDIIFAAAGMSGNGIIQAAKNNGKFVIGVDSDQDHMAKGFVLTSVMKRLDSAVYAEVVRVARTKFQPGTIRYGLANGGIALSPMRYTEDLIGPEILGRIRDAEARIIAGSLQVTDVLQGGRYE